MTEIASRADAVAPRALEHILGQDSVIKTLRMMVQSYFNDRAADRRASFQHLIFCGPSGTGKTMTANVLANELAARFVEVSGEAFCFMRDINQTLVAREDGDILFIDEVHAISDTTQTVLLKALAERKLSLEGGQERQPKTIELADFLCVGATTDEFRLHPALLQRFFRLRFQPYAEEDIVRILKQRLPALKWQVEDGVLELVASRSKQTPRIALRLLQSVYMRARAGDEDTLTVAHAEDAMRLLQIDNLGLDPLEQEVLRVLAEGGGGPMPLNVIASKLGGILPRNLSQVIEVDLVRQGLIGKQPQGRVLTSKGWGHVRASGVIEQP